MTDLPAENEILDTDSLVELVEDAFTIELDDLRYADSLPNITLMPDRAAQFLERERPYFEESVLEVEETVDNYCRVEAHPRDDSIHDWYRDRLHDDEPMVRLQVQYR